jgi:hypothetical protein
MAYSLHLIGAGITQLVECQLPKLNVAGSKPVARSILLLIMLAFLAPGASASDDPDPIRTGDWVAASGAYLVDREFDGTYPSIADLESSISNGDRSELMPLIWMLVRTGRTPAAEIWLEGRGIMVPVTRRDLGIALAWYGRYSLYDLLSSGMPIPPDLEQDDNGPTLAAVVTAGWMHLCPDGMFHSDALIGPADLEPIASVFFGGEIIWERSWISMSELDELFHMGSFMGNE